MDEIREPDETGEWVDLTGFIDAIENVVEIFGTTDFSGFSTPLVFQMRCRQLCYSDGTTEFSTERLSNLVDALCWLLLGVMEELEEPCAVRDRVVEINTNESIPELRANPCTFVPSWSREAAERMEKYDQMTDEEFWDEFLNGDFLAEMTEEVLLMLDNKKLAEMKSVEDLFGVEEEE